MTARHLRADAAHGGVRRGSALLRPCPRCGAGPGKSCMRKPAGKVGGQDVGGGYLKPLKNVHAERRATR